MSAWDVDVLVVGAGLSGIAAGYHLQTRCPNHSYAIVEARQSLGGTWDLFRYPGIRSDSDMFTLGYSFRPWKDPQAIADGPSILRYIRETAEAYGIDRKIRYGLRVTAASWSTAAARWSVRLVDVATDEALEVTCRFLFVCAGYYDYDQGYTPALPGLERFTGTVVHPQKWTDDIDHAGKRVVVVGSGATAITLVPALSERAAHVTMLQRSPTYVMSLPVRDVVADVLRDRLPSKAAYAITRWKNVLVSLAFYQWCRRFPRLARRYLLREVERMLGDAAEISPHFDPSYDPWDQRLCVVPDADLFQAIRAGKASVVTGHIETFTERGIRLRSGQELEADLVVTATGLRVKLLGGMTLDVDGRTVVPAQTVVYKGTMLSDVPNLAMAVGYTNASWTLKCELSAHWVCRVLRHMERHGYTMCVPRGARASDDPLLDLKSGYIRRVLHDLPRQGSSAPWRMQQNYLLDRVWLRRFPVRDRTLRFSTPNAAARTEREREAI